MRKKWYGFQSDVSTIQQVTEDLEIDNNTWRLGPLWRLGHMYVETLRWLRDFVTCNYSL